MTIATNDISLDKACEITNKINTVSVSVYPPCNALQPNASKTLPELQNHQSPTPTPCKPPSSVPSNAVCYAARVCSASFWQSSDCIRFNQHCLPAVTLLDFHCFERKRKKNLADEMKRILFAHSLLSAGVSLLQSRCIDATRRPCC